MKESLQKSIQLFTFSDRLRIYYILLCKKLQIGITDSLEQLFKQFIYYAGFFEKGVVLKNEDDHLFRAELKVNNKSLVVFVRKKSSDLEVLESVLLNGEYKIAVERLIKTSAKDNFNIIDAGGNIGLTTLYLFSFFPASRFIVIEPDKENQAVLNKNLDVNGISNAVILQMGLWTNDEKLVIDNTFRDGKEWSLTVSQLKNSSNEHSVVPIDGISLQRICSDYDIAAVDLLKMDIEGAERFLFVNKDFLNVIKSHVKNVVIEIHDEFNIRDTIMQEMQLADFLPTESGDVTFFGKQ